jgi:hypothetical protein
MTALPLTQSQMIVKQNALIELMYKRLRDHLPNIQELKTTDDGKAALRDFQQLDAIIDSHLYNCRHCDAEIIKSAKMDCVRMKG